MGETPTKLDESPGGYVGGRLTDGSNDSVKDTGACEVSVPVEMKVNLVRHHCTTLLTVR